MSSLPGFWKGISGLMKTSSFNFTLRMYPSFSYYFSWSRMVSSITIWSILYEHWVPPISGFSGVGSSHGLTVNAFMAGVILCDVRLNTLRNSFRTEVFTWASSSPTIVFNVSFFSEDCVLGMCWTFSFGSLFTMYYPAPKILTEGVLAARHITESSVLYTCILRVPLLSTGTVESRPLTLIALPIMHLHCLISSFHGIINDLHSWGFK